MTVEVGAAETDCYAEIEGPVDRMYLAWGPAGITAVERVGDPMGFELEVAMRTGRPIRRVDRVPDTLRHQVERQLAGEWQPDLAIDLGGLSAFQRTVLRKVMEIPWGEVRPYAWVAREVGRPRAVRAVGSTLAANPIPFVIPCHRVIRTDGHIGEYGAGGPEAKMEVMRTEGIDPGELERLADAGVRYLGDDSTDVFCYPTCRHIRQAPAANRVSFRSGDEATATDYRPCGDCRPLERAVFAT